MLKRIRIILAYLFFIAFLLLFVDVSSTLPSYLSFLAKWQFIPALRAGSFVTLGVLLLITTLFGRVYCSTLCPLGVMQDMFFKFGKKYRFRFSKPKNKLRYIVLGVFVLSFVAHLPIVFGILEPYSAFGRIASAIVAPVWTVASNLLGSLFDGSGFITIAPTPVWLQGISTLVVAILTLATIGFMSWKWGRTWCNTMCPVGTIFGFISPRSAFRPTIETSGCAGCRRCEKMCKSSCIDSEKRTIDLSRCVACFGCMEECSSKALTYSFQWKKRNNTPPNPSNDSRRAAIATAVAVGLVSFTAEAKTTDGAQPDLSRKSPPKRETKITPPGSSNYRQFHGHCTGCQLCVAACPHQVLRASDSGLKMLQPTLSFERGYCRLNCVTCSKLCPTGAIRPIKVEDRAGLQVGLAVIREDLCAIAVDDIPCNACFRVCPTNAISMVEDGDKMRPKIDADRCIGCGACEYVCPTRPVSAVCVQGNLIHKRLGSVLSKQG